VKVWKGSFYLAQWRLQWIAIAGVHIAVIALLSGIFSDPDRLHAKWSFVPQYFGMQNLIFRVALALLLLWSTLSFVVTVVTRLRIARENQVRPKR
jgi:hypothetical protein